MRRVLRRQRDSRASPAGAARIEQAAFGQKSSLAARRASAARHWCRRPAWRVVAPSGHGGVIAIDADQMNRRAPWPASQASGPCSGQSRKRWRRIYGRPAPARRNASPLASICAICFLAKARGNQAPRPRHRCRWFCTSVRLRRGSNAVSFHAAGSGQRNRFRKRIGAQPGDAGPPPRFHCKGHQNLAARSGLDRNREPKTMSRAPNMRHDQAQPRISMAFAGKRRGSRRRWNGSCDREPA